MITLKNASAVGVVPILSMIFFASPAMADWNWSDDNGIQRVRRNYYFITYVSTTPAGYLPVIINGGTYFVYQGVFYQRTFSRYEAVDPSTLVPNGPFTIGILNSGGGYTQVQMDVGANGFIGPQGEFYPQFPPIQQLQAMYVQ